MRLFKLADDNKLTQVKETKIAKERILQSIAEKNLTALFGLDYVCSEFSVGDYRLDTLAFDPETNSFVIIEYKRSENRSVIDQGYAYLGKMLDRKADFVLKYNLVKNKSYQIKDIDWEQSRIYFVSTAFNTYQLGSLIFNDLPISLWEVKTYQGNHISFRRIDYGSSGASIRKISPSNTSLGKVTRAIIVYTETDHLQKASEEIRSLFETVRDSILGRWNLTMKPLKHYIAFKGNTNIVDIQLQRSQLKLTINVPKGTLVDSIGITSDVSSKGKLGNGDYQVTMKDDSQLSSIMSLIEQSNQYHS
jgi:predicted transport protein